MAYIEMYHVYLDQPIERKCFSFKCCESNLILEMINYFLQPTFGGMVMMMMKMTKMMKRKTKMASLTG